MFLLFVLVLCPRGAVGSTLGANDTYSNSSETLSFEPSSYPSVSPTPAPSDLSMESSESPSPSPSAASESPSAVPSVSPTGSVPSAPPTPAPTSGTPTSGPSRNPSLKPSIFHSDDETDHPTGTPTEDPLYAELEDGENFGHTVDKVIIGVCTAAAVGVLVMLVWSFVKQKFGAAGMYLNVSTDGSERPKKKGFKKFEDYWDEESEDQSKKGGTSYRASANYEDYWDEKNDLSTHSNQPLNISLPKRT